MNRENDLSKTVVEAGFDLPTQWHIERHRRKAAQRTSGQLENVGSIAARVLRNLFSNSNQLPPDPPAPMLPRAA